MLLHLSRLHFPITTLGPGRRIGIWFQGCTLGCPGCVSADTWDRGKGQTTVARVLEAIAPWLLTADGVTISGGEPLQQAAALESLLLGIRAATGSDFDVLVYSGFPWEKIAARVIGWNGLADALIAGPFEQSAAQTLAWRGSDNQTLHPLTPLGIEKYSPWVSAKRDAAGRALDLYFHENEVWMAGIPDSDTLKTIRAELTAEGFSSVSSARTPPVFA